MKILTIDTIGSDMYDNRDAFLFTKRLIEIAKEAGYTHVYDNFKDKTYEIDEAIKMYRII